jgi:hypothetical protein
VNAAAQGADEAMGRSFSSKIGARWQSNANTPMLIAETLP